MVIYDDIETALKIIKCPKLKMCMLGAYFHRYYCNITVMFNF